MFSFFRNLLPKKFSDRLISEQTFCVMDTETTGLNYKKGDQIIQIGAVKVNNNHILKDKTYDQLIDPEINIPTESTLIHGIKPQDILDKPKIREIEHEFSKFIGSDVIVGHNIDFDYGLIKKTIPYSELNLKFKTNPILDTLSLTIGLFPELKSYELTFLCELFQIRKEKRHTALGDSLMTAELLIILLKKSKEQGIKNIYELKKIMNNSNEIKRLIASKQHY